MREQLFGQLIQTLQERAGLDTTQAEQVAGVVGDFAQQHLPELASLASPALAGDEGNGGGLLGGVMGGVGQLLGGRG